MSTGTGYTELTEQYRVEDSLTGLTGTRAFHDEYAGSSPTGTVALPALGDRFTNDTTASEYRLTVVSRTKVKWGKHPNKHLWTINYSANFVGQPAQHSGNQTTGTDKLPVKGRLGGEFLSIDGENAGNQYKWGTGSPIVGTKINQAIPFKIITGNFTISKRLTELDLYTLHQYNGCINSVAMKIANATYAVGVVLYEGLDYEDYYNSKSERRWKVDMSFSIKVQRQSPPPAAAVYVGWNYILDERIGQFHLTTPLLYALRDLNYLINLKEDS